MNEPIPSRSYSIGLLCSSGSWGGLEMNVLRLGGWLNDRGWQVVLYGQQGTRLFREAEKNGLITCHLHSTFKYGDLINARRLARYAIRDNVRRLIINYGKDLFLAVLAKRLSERYFKLIMQQHMHVGGHKKDAFHTWEYKNLDAWIAPLPMFKERLTDYTRLDPEKIHVIPFGIELDRLITNRPDRTAARESLKLPNNAYIAGIVGRLEEKKGQADLIRACHRVHQAGLKLHLAVVGDKTANDPAGFREHLDDLVEKYRLREYVHFRPHQADVSVVYSALDLFVMASHSETYGMVTIEAMASGLPVIGTAAGGTVQIIRDGENGLLVPPQDYVRLSEAIIRLMNNPGLCRDLASRAAIDAVEKYSHLRQVMLVESLMEKL